MEDQLVLQLAWMEVEVVEASSLARKPAVARESLACYQKNHYFEHIKGKYKRNLATEGV